MTTHHLLALATMTPLSMEKASRGSPKMFQAWILMGSPRHLLRENSLEQGIFASCNTSYLLLSYCNRMHFQIMNQ